MKHVKKVLIGTVLLALAVFTAERFVSPTDLLVQRNAYGEGKKTEEYELTIENELDKETFTLEVAEQQYTKAEVQELFQTVMDRLDKVVLGENLMLQIVPGGHETAVAKLGLYNFLQLIFE